MFACNASVCPVSVLASSVERTTGRMYMAPYAPVTDSEALEALSATGEAIEKVIEKATSGVRKTTGAFLLERSARARAFGFFDGRLESEQL